MFGGAVVHRAVVLIAAVLLFGAPARAQSQTGIAAGILPAKPRRRSV